MQPDYSQPNSLVMEENKMKNTGLISAIIYTGISLLISGLFVIATLPGQYTSVDRIGGAVWVFILSMIILMPLIIPAVNRKRQ
jgi:hypothetical protein